MSDAADVIEWTRQLIAMAGPLGWLAYVLLVTVEVVVAPLPGILLYIPGGIIFGPWLGGTLALAGNILGAGLASWISRRVSVRWLRGDEDVGRLSRLRARLQQRGFFLIVMLRLNPLTSSDLVSWAAGLAGIPPARVMLSTGLGILPLCYLQSFLSDSVFRAWPGLFLPFLLITPVYLGIVLKVLLQDRNASSGQDGNVC